MTLLDSLSLKQVLKSTAKQTFSLPQGRCCMQAHPSCPGTQRSLSLCRLSYHMPEHNVTSSKLRQIKTSITNIQNLDSAKPVLCRKLQVVGLDISGVWQVWMTLKVLGWCIKCIWSLLLRVYYLGGCNKSSFSRWVFLQARLKLILLHLIRGQEL